MNKPIKQIKSALSAATGDYSGLVSGVSELLEAARRASARTVNALMTATYWEIGRRIVEFEQRGEVRAGYGEKLLEQLSRDLSKRFGRGFGQRNVEGMRRFHLAMPAAWVCAGLKAKEARLAIPQTVSAEFNQSTQPISQTLSADCLTDISQTPSGKSALSPVFSLSELAQALPLPWSPYVLLVRRSRSPEAFAFYHAEALRGGWSVRQLQRQMDSQFFGLKLGRFTQADAGQMHLYLNCARENWVQPGENPPVGVILCSGKSEALVR
jgi:hypothetical protein